LGNEALCRHALVDATTGTQHWAETTDQPLAELAGLARMMTRRIEIALHYRFLKVDMERSVGALSRDPTARDLILRARAHVSLASPRAGMEEARRLLERALALDEASADAHALQAHVLATFVNSGWTDDGQKTQELADRHVERALAIDPRHLRGHYVRGMIRQNQRRFDEAIAEFDLAIDMAPSWVVAYVRRGAVRILTGRPAEGVPDILEAMRISPRDPWMHFWYDYLGLASLMLGRDEEALGHFVRAHADRGRALGSADLAPAYWLIGRTEEARAALADYLLARPNTTMTGLRTYWFRHSDDPLYRATRERQLDALRRLGLPEE
jgi:adenylate cyclase